MIDVFNLKPEIKVHVITEVTVGGPLFLIIKELTKLVVYLRMR